MDNSLLLVGGFPLAATLAPQLELGLYCLMTDLAKTLTIFG